MIETYTAGQNLLTRHPPESYRGVVVVRVAPHHGESFICPGDGQTFRALGGEKIYGYETPAGVRAQGFSLRAGDRATRVRSDLPSFLCEWRIERA